MTKMKNRYFVLSAALCAVLCVALAAFAGCDNSSGGGQSGDASLKALAFVDGSNHALELTVVSSGDTRTASVAHSVAALTVTATAGHDKATVGGDSGVKRNLEVGPNTLSITITAENGTARTYTVIITRDASDEDREAALAFETDHAAVLALTTTTVTASHEAAVNAALAAYNALSVGAKTQVAAGKKALLDSLKARIDELNDTAAVDAAYAAWNGLTAGAQALAPEGTAAKVQALKAKIDELNAPTAVAGFLADHGAFFNTAPAALTLGDAASLTGARAAYNALSSIAKAQLTAEYAKLQALEAQMAALRAVDAFRTTHAAALALDPATVEVTSEEIVDAALAAHASLSVDAQALATTEKTRLDALKAAIRLQKFGSAFVSIANGQMEDEDFAMEPVSLNKKSPVSERIVAFILGSGYTAIRWSVDAADLGWADDAGSFAFDAADWAVGNHILGVTVEKDGRSWSKSIIIAVSNDTL